MLNTENLCRVVTQWRDGCEPVTERTHCIPLAGTSGDPQSSQSTGAVAEQLGQFTQHSRTPAGSSGRWALLRGATTPGVRRAELAPSDSEPSPTVCVADPLVRVVRGRRGGESGRPQGQTPREGIWWELGSDRYCSSSQILDELSLCCISATHRVTIGYLRS